MNPAFFMKLMSFAMDCIPKDQLDVCSYIFRLGCGDIPPDEETPEYIRQYDTIVKEFLEGGKGITIHVDTGEVRCYKPKPHEVFDTWTCVIINDYFEQLKASRPELLRRYLDDLYAQLDEERAAIDKDRNVRSSEVFFDMAHQISFIYAMILAPEVLRNMESMGEHADDDFPYCLYYYCAFDGGMRQMTAMMRSNLDKSKTGMMGYVAKKLLTQLFVDKSFELGYEREKKGRKDTADKEPEESAGFIRQLLSKFKLTGGKRKRKTLSLDELLIGDKDALKKLIKDYWSKLPNIISLGYLLYMLGGRPLEKTRSSENQEDIEKDFLLVRKIHIQCCTFRNFCQVTTEFLGVKMPKDLKRVSKAYLLCKCEEYNITEETAEKFSEYRKGKYRKARMATQEWIPKFNEID